MMSRTGSGAAHAAIFEDVDAQTVTGAAATYSLTGTGVVSVTAGADATDSITGFFAILETAGVGAT